LCKGSGWHERNNERQKQRANRDQFTHDSNPS
jgi:hypothetical protein